MPRYHQAIIRAGSSAIGHYLYHNRHHLRRAYSYIRDQKRNREILREVSQHAKDNEMHHMRTQDQGIEDQYHQTKVLYRKRPISKRGRKKLRKKIKRHLIQKFVSLAETPHVHVARTYSVIGVTNGNSENSQQGWVSLTLFGNNTFTIGANQDTTDLTLISSDCVNRSLANAGSVGTVGPPTRDNVKLVLYGCRMDVTLTNILTTTVEIDIYFVKCRKNVQTGQTSDANSFLENWMSNEYNSGANQTTSAFCIASGVNYRGIEPWQIPSFCSHFLITEVRRITLPGLGVITFVHNVKKMFDYDGETFTEDDAWLKGKTEALLFRFRGLWDGTDTTNYYVGPASIAIQAKKVYKYKHQGQPSVGMSYQQGHP